ncbi:MAG TPA: hypothetical protein VH417_02930 [Vicinamibacterales bacterium]|jgi:hypothetical protein
MKRILVILAVSVAIPVASAFSQTTISYSASVTSASGADATAFSPGDSLSFSYTLNPAVADTNSDPGAGVFPNAVTSLSVSFPGRGVAATAGAAGPVQTFDNVIDGGTGNWSDQIFIIGGPISSSTLLGGSPIDYAEIDFLSGFLVPPDEPVLISSDAIPLSRLNGLQNFVILHTANGDTFVNFNVIETPVVHVTANGAEDQVTLTPGAPLDVRIGFDAGPAGVVNPAQVYIGVITPFAPFVFWLNPSMQLVSSPTPVIAFTGALSSFGPTTLVSLPNSSVLPSGSYLWFMIVDDDNNGVLDGKFHDFVQTIVP